MKGLIATVMSIVSLCTPVYIQDMSLELLQAQATIYIDGVEYTPKDDFNDKLQQLLSGSHTTPALGVCFEEQVNVDRLQGVWIVWAVDGTHMHNELPYNKLMINILPDYYGFNILREYDDKYNGRCIYLNLDKNSIDFYNYIISYAK